MLIPANNRSHGKQDYRTGIYYWDWERFRDIVDKNLETDFD